MLQTGKAQMWKEGFLFFFFSFGGSSGWLALENTVPRGTFSDSYKLKNTKVMIYIVKYYAGTYEGRQEVEADDQEEAIAKVKRYVRRNMTMSMYADGYKVVSSNDEEDDDSI